MNQLVVKHLQQISALYLIKGDNWRSGAYARAAENVAMFREPINKSNVRSIPCVGAGVADVILQYQKKGNSNRFKDLGKEVNPACLTMTIVKGVGPKSAWKFYQNGIKNFDQLVKAWKRGKLAARFDEPMHQAIAKQGERVNKYAAAQMAEALLAAMQHQKGVVRAAIAGSVRRKKDTSKDIDILVSAKNSDKARIINHFAKLGKVINKGPTKASIWFRLNENTIQADLLVVPDASFGAALQYFTGSREHNIEVRRKAQRKGYKVNERGIYKNNRKVGGKNEEDIYRMLKIDMPAPEDR